MSSADVITDALDDADSPQQQVPQQQPAPAAANVQTGVQTPQQEPQQSPASPGTPSGPAVFDALLVVARRPVVRHWLGFAVGNVVFILLLGFGFTVLQLVAYAVLALIAGSFVYNKGRLLLSGSFSAVSQPVFVEVVHADQWPMARVQGTIAMINALYSQLLNVFLCTDVALTARVATAVYLLGVFSRWFGGLALMYMIFLGVYIWPVVEAKYGAVIYGVVGQLVALVMQRVGGLMHTLFDLLPKHSTPGPKTPSAASTPSSSPLAMPHKPKPKHD